MKHPGKLAAIILGLFAALSAARAEPAKVAIGYPLAADFLATIAAKDKGFFKKHDIDATITRVPIITNVPPALISNSLQIGATTIPTMLQAIDGGLDFKLIAGAGRHLRRAPFISLLVRKDVKVEKPANLEGKKVGMAGVNSVMELFLRKWMIDRGGDPRKVTFVEAPLPQLPDMLKASTVDAVLMVEPLRSMIVTSGTGYIGGEFIADVDPNVLVSGFIATSEWTRANPTVIKNFHAALDDGLAYIKSGAADLKEIEKKSLGFNTPTMPTFDNKATPEDLKIHIAIGKELGLYRTNLDATKLVTP